MNIKLKKISPYLKAVLIIVLLFFPLIIYCYHFRNLKISSVNSDWGVFGDYIGGTIGSIVTLIGFVYIYKTYKSQVENYYISGFENTLFRMIEFHHKIIDGLQYKKKQKEITGRSALYEYSVHMVRTFREDFRIKRDDDEYYQKFTDFVREKFGILYDKRFFEIGHYFRHLYHIFKFINESKLSKANKLKYAKIIRAQLSSEELILIGINGMTEYGVKFKELIEEYSLLHRLMNFDVFRSLFISFYKKKAFGDEDIFNTLPEGNKDDMVYYKLLERTIK